MQKSLKNEKILLNQRCYECKNSNLVTNIINTYRYYIGVSGINNFDFGIFFKYTGVSLT